MDDLYFKFTVPFEDSEKLGTATIEAYNLSPATRNSIKKGMPIMHPILSSISGTSGIS